jgi:hypothetical protein
MTEAEWLRCDDARELLRYALAELGAPATPAGVRKLRLFACATVRLHWNNLPDARSRAAIEFAELLADDKANLKKLAKVQKDADKATDQFSSAPWRPEWTAALDARALVAWYPDPKPDSHNSMCISLPESNKTYYAEWKAQLSDFARMLRDIFGNPFRPVIFDPAWRTSDVLLLARGIYEERAFDRMPILADALEEAGCTNEDILAHCRDANQPHARGCWVVDLVLGKE